MSNDYIQVKERFPAEEYEPTEADWIFSAGVVVGEGHVSEQRFPQKNGGVKAAIMIAVRMQDEQCIRHLARTWGLGCRMWTEEKVSRPLWHVSTSGAKAERIIRRIYPYLQHTHKGQQVREAFDFLGLPL